MSDEMRGIDFYSLPTLFNTARRIAQAYQLAHGHAPTAIRPRSFNEKVIWSLFFAKRRVPESGNKLLTGFFVPDELRHEINIPEIVWSSDSAVLPDNADIEPGAYYLKASHGTDMYRRVKFPLAPHERQTLHQNAVAWLGNPCGLKSGEWWYNTFKPCLLLERDVIGTADSLSWNFFVSNGDVFAINLVRKEGGMQLLWLTPDGIPFNQQPSCYPTLPFEVIDEIALQRMRKVASRLGMDHDLVRIDFLWDGAKIYLGEITFSPGNGLSSRPYRLDLELGSKVRLKAA